MLEVEQEYLRGIRYSLNGLEDEGGVWAEVRGEEGRGEQMGGGC